MKWDRKAVSEWGCIVSGFVAMASAIIWFFGIKPQTGLWFPLLAILAACACATLFYLGKRLDRLTPVATVPTPRLDAAKRELDKMLADRRIYIGPSGTSIRLVNEKLRVSLCIFPCVTVQLLHVKVEVGSSLYNKATLTDAEPHELEAGKKFEKTLERSLDDVELEEMKRDFVLVQGTAKFGGNLEVPFSFNAPPLRI